jgi:hypothetical protein
VTEYPTDQALRSIRPDCQSNEGILVNRFVGIGASDDGDSLITAGRLVGLGVYFLFVCCFGML